VVAALRPAGARARHAGGRWREQQQQQPRCTSCTARLTPPPPPLLRPQGESHVTVVHSVRPFGPRHISQLTAAFETLRPQLKDTLYTLEWNTFR
jgi:hypothetical protein